MPRLIVIAGPNGAGKTTFAREYLAAEDRSFEFVNADEIARTLSTQRGSPAADIQAARLMLARIDELADTVPISPSKRRSQRSPTRAKWRNGARLDTKFLSST